MDHGLINTLLCHNPFDARSHLLLNNRKYSVFFNYWFGIGVVFGFLSLFGSIALLVMNLYWMFAEPQADPVLTPVVGSSNVEREGMGGDVVPFDPVDQILC